MLEMPKSVREVVVPQIEKIPVGSGASLGRGKVALKRTEIYKWALGNSAKFKTRTIDGVLHVWRVA